MDSLALLAHVLADTLGLDLGVALVAKGATQEQKRYKFLYMLLISNGLSSSFQALFFEKINCYYYHLSNQSNWRLTKLCCKWQKWINVLQQCVIYCVKIVHGVQMYG